MRSILAPILVALTCLATCGAAAAAPLFGDDDLQRNGAVARHVWTPNFASGEIGGMRLSAGVALGLRGPLQASLGRSVMPAITLGLRGRSSVSLLPAGGRGAMLVLQTAP